MSAAKMKARCPMVIEADQLQADVVTPVHAA
jgi:hypothetical protein